MGDVGSNPGANVKIYFKQISLGQAMWLRKFKILRELGVPSGTITSESSVIIGLVISYRTNNLNSPPSNSIHSCKTRDTEQLEAQVAE